MFVKATQIRIVLGDIFSLKADAIVSPLKTAGANKGYRFSKYIFGDRSISQTGKASESRVRLACRNALKSGERLKISSIAFASLGCKDPDFPPVASAKIMAQELLRHLSENRSCLKKVVFCLGDKKTYKVFEKNCLGYLDYIVNKLKSPFLTVDAIIRIKGRIVLIKRSNPPFGWALPGGFVDYGESLEQAVVREAREETGLKITGLRQFHTYSDPKRDPRFHTVGTVFIARAKGIPRAGDDAAGVRLVGLKEIKSLDFAFDHKKILLDYLKQKKI